MNNDFRDVLLGRHSVRRFDKSVKISHEEMNEMFDETLTAPSACNLQSWKFVVVDTPEGREKLRSYFMKFNYPQVDDSSAVVLVFGNTKAHEKYSELWHKMYDEKKVTKEAMESALNTFMPLYEHASREMLVADAMVDASLASMQFMLVAREHGYETNPIAGYDASKAAELFGLDPVQYVPVMAIAVGKPEPGAKEITTTRYSVDEVVDYE